MYTCNVALLFITMSCFSTSKALPVSCKPDWKIDWNRQPQDFSNFLPFSNPGEILPGETVNDTLQFVGLLWNAPSWQELVGRVCIQYGPTLNAQYPGEQIRRECDMLIASLQKGEKSDIFGSCTSYWDQIGVENTTRNMISNYDQCLWYDIKQDIPSFDGSMCDLDPLVTVYATNLIEKTSRVAFDLLEWLGPSPFSGDVYGACSALRILLSYSIDQIIDEVKNLLKYPVADVLEYLNFVDICSHVTVQDILNLLPISQQDDEYICDFLSKDPTREEYLEKGAKLIETVLSVPVDDGLCNDVLTFVSSYDGYDVSSYQITGRNLTSDSSRRQFCREIASALSDNSPYTPTPYSFSFDEIPRSDSSSYQYNPISPSFSNVDQSSDSSSQYNPKSDYYSSQYNPKSDSSSSSQYNPKSDYYSSQYKPKSDYYSSQYYPASEYFPVGMGNGFIYGEAGQLFPDFSFIEAVNVLGAFLRSDTLTDGGVVLCDVFESFLSELEPSFSTMCTALRNDDTATVEKMCLTLSLPPRYYHPSLRTPTAIYMGVTGVDMTRKLFELSVISRDHVCSALDTFFHSKNNLQSVVRFGLDVYLAELLPIADKICKDYDSVLNFLESNSYLDVTDVTKFQNIAQVFIDSILTHLGFSDRNRFCQTIAAGIDPSSGRAKSSLAETMQEQVLLFLTDSGRCEESANSLRRMLVEIGLEMDFSELFTQYTGYNSITSACENLSVFFDADLCNGRNLTSDSNRRECCEDIATTLSDNSPFIPTPNSFPNDQDIENMPETKTVPSAGDTPEFSRVVIALTVLMTYLMYML